MVRVRAIEKLLFQDQELSQLEIDEMLSAPDFKEGSRQSHHDNLGTKSPQGVIQVDIEMPGSEVLELKSTAQPPFKI